VRRLLSESRPADLPKVMAGRWSLSATVALREEPFGAMAYDFSTRRLSFLKHPGLVDVVRRLERHTSALDACREAGVGDRELPAFAEGLRRLAETGMLVRLPTQPTRAAGTEPDAAGAHSVTGPAAEPARRPAIAAGGGGALADRFERGLQAPICLTWELTYACNLSCVHCLSSSGRRDPGELSTSECEKLIDEMEELKVFYVNVGGGEPTIRRDFWHLVDYATAHRVGVKFSTNGTRITASAAARLAASDYVDVQLSLDGATAEVNDAVRGAGSYATVRRAMANLAGAGVRGFKLSVVVTRENVDQLDLFKSLADEHGAQLRVTRLRPSGRGADVWARLHPTPQQQRLVYEWLRAQGDGVLTGDSFFHLGAFGDPLPGLNLCGAGRVVCLIDPVGDVYACPFTIHEDFRAGNVRGAGGFGEVWRSAALFTGLRAPSEGGACNACSSFGTCRGGCMASKYFTGLPLDGPDPECVKGHGEGPLARVRPGGLPRPSTDHSSGRTQDPIPERFAARVPIALTRPASRRTRVTSPARTG
jgi:mycofactocin biosynthetic radical S-adenosylmethionine protein MftC